MKAADDRPADNILAYKPSIDGLRAISIVAVVAYHAGLPGIPGGFVGVDVFFVISGYLIINQIAAGLGAGKFSFGEFWARRVLRILPSYLLVIAATLALTPFVLATGPEFDELGREAAASAAMIVNITFFLDQGYFAAAAETKPLLHLWSLAVEEQFYLVAPLILFALSGLFLRPGRGRRMLGMTIVGALLAGSFALCVAAGKQGFYLTPYRAWEFILGGLIPLAVPALRRTGGIAVGAVAFLGIGLIGLAVVMLTDKMPYPTYYALLPVVGACLIITASLASERNPVARLLATPPFVRVGLVSYAWYLWHWPLLTFARIHNFGQKEPAWDAGAALLSLALAAATYTWLELPIRRWRQRGGSTRQGWRIVGAGVAAAAAVGLAAIPSMGFMAGNAEPIALLPVENVDYSCLLDGAKPLDPACVPEAGLPFGVLVGNSHALMVFPTLKEETERRGGKLAGLMRSACPVFYPTELLSAAGLEEECNEYFTDAAKTIRTLPRQPDFVILAARWNNGKAADAEVELPGSEELAAIVGGLQPPNGLRPALTIGLGAFLTEIATWHPERILIVGPVPEFVKDTTTCLAQADKRGLDRDVCSRPRSKIAAGREATMETLRFLAGAFPRVRLIDPIDVFCDRLRCRPYDDGGVLYADADHLTRRGTEKLRAAFTDDFAWALTGGGPEVAVTAPGAPTTQ